MVLVSLEETEIRVLEGSGVVEVFVSKDLETSTNFSVTVQTQSGTATGEVASYIWTVVDYWTR